MKTDAYRATSVGARALLLELRANYNFNAENAVFMSSRDGAKRLNAHKDTVRKWLHELEHYGFIVEVQGAHLGVNGVGKAAHYRLTDCGFAGKIPATRDFEKWDGTLYDPKKQNPVRKNRPHCPKKLTIRTESQMDGNGNKCPTEATIRTANRCPTEPTITSLTTPLLIWSTPTVAEVTDREEEAAIRKQIRLQDERDKKFGPNSKAA